MTFFVISMSLLASLVQNQNNKSKINRNSPSYFLKRDGGFALCDREIYECLSGSFPSFYLVVSGKKRNFAVKLDVELKEWRMKQVEERYISLLTDFGFKRIFGTAMNKDLLICFLNSLFNGKQVVKDVSYLNPEHVGDVYTDRKAIFDVYCEGENGEKFIVEMQNAYQTYFKDRSLFYSTFPIREQAPKGSDWDFKLNHVYTVALLNFNMNEDAFDQEKIRHHIQLCDTATHKIFYDKLEFIYVEIAKFNKTLGELETLYEKWLYALKNLYKLTQRPKELCDKVFDRLFEEAEIAKFTPLEMREYEASKMAYRDIKNSIDTAKQEGKQEGLAEGMEKGMEKGIEIGKAEGMEKGMNQKALDIARNMLADGVDINLIMKYSGLTLEQIEKLK